MWKHQLRVLDFIVYRKDIPLLRSLSQRASQHLQRKKGRKWRPPYSFTVARSSSAVFRMPKVQQAVE